MTLTINALGYFVNLCLFLLMRKRKEKIDFVVFFAIGIILNSSIYYFVWQLICVFSRDNRDIITGWFMLLSAFGIAAYWGWNELKLQDYRYEKSRMFVGIAMAAAMLLTGCFFECFLSLEFIQNLLLWGSGGIIFYAAIQVKTNSKTLKILEVLLSFLYLCGYPMANLLSGNVLLTLVMNWLLLVFWYIEKYEKGKASLNELMSILACAFIVFAIGFQTGYLVCVILAAPGILRIYQQNTARFRQMSGVIAVGMVIAVIYILVRYGGGQMYSDYRIFAASMYSNLWSDCAFWIFPLLIFIGKQIKSPPQVDWKLYWLIMAVVTYLFCLGSSILKKRDSFDGYNIFYILWLIVIYVAAKSIIHTYEDDKYIMLSYMLVFVATLFFMLSGVEEHLQKQNIWFCTQVKADSFLKVYSWNKNVFSCMGKGVSSGQQELYDRVEMLVGEDDTIPYIIGDDMPQIRYFCEQTGQKDCWRYFYQMQSVLLNAKQMQPEVWKHYIFNKYDNVPYILIKKNSDLYWYGIEMYGQMEIIYENNFGMLLKTE